MPHENAQTLWVAPYDILSSSNVSRDLSTAKKVVVYVYIYISVRKVLPD